MTAFTAASAQKLFDLDQWRSCGFAISREPWLAGQVDELHREYTRVIDNFDRLARPPVRYSVEDPARQDHLEMLSHVHWASGPVDNIARSEQFGCLAAELLSVRRVRLWGTSFICKYSCAGAKNHVSWHRDMSFWRCLNAPRLLTFWVALNPVSAENGSMEFALGSHLVPAATSGNDVDLGAYESFPLEGPAGTVSVHHCLTGHRSGPNRSGTDRIAMTLHYMDADLQYVPGTPSDRHINVPLIAHRNGDSLDDSYFPVVYAGG